MGFFNDVIKRKKNPEDDELEKFNNPDYFRNNAPDRSYNEELTQEEKEALLMQRNDAPVSQPVQMQNAPVNQAQPQNQSQNPAQLYNEKEWQDDGILEDTIKGTVYQQAAKQEEKTYHAPQITFPFPAEQNQAPPVYSPQQSEASVPQEPQAQSSFSQQPQAELKTFQASSQQPMQNQSLQPPNTIQQRQSMPQQTFQAPSAPAPQRSFTKDEQISPLTSYQDDFSNAYNEDFEETAESDTKPKKAGIVGIISSIFDKKKKPKKPKATTPKKKKNQDEDDEEKKKESDPKRVMVLGVLLLILAGLGYWVFSMFAPNLFSSNNNSQTNNNNAKNKGKTSVVLVENRSGNIPQNPFVPKSQVAALAVVEGVFPKKNLPSGTTTPVAGSQPVTIPRSAPTFTPPAIPQAHPAISQPMTLPTLKAPTAAINQAPAAVANEPAKLTGIIETDGKTMAVMSDGTVVSSGDTYNDGRIAYIGGDGIHFDNGKTMRFEE